MAAVLAPDAGAVGVTTGLVGAGGFGKTTLARMVAHDPRVRAGFGGGVVWVTVGEDAEGPELAGEAGVGGAVVRPDRGGGDRPAGRGGCAGAGAGRAAGAAGGRRRVVDRAGGAVPDRWGSGWCGCSPPAKPGCCPIGWPGCGWIRWPRPRPTSCSPPGSLRCLRGWSRMRWTATGRWPVLLSLVHGAVRDAVREGADPAGELREVLAALAGEGITALDAGNPGERSAAVAATIEVSLRRLTPDEQARYRELAVFGEDVAIPGEVVARLWAHTGGWSRFQARRLCSAAVRPRAAGRLPARPGPAGAARRDPRLPARHIAGAVGRVGRGRGRRPPGPAAARWRVGRPARRARSICGRGWRRTCAGRVGATELETVLADPRWLVTKLEQVGPAGLESDLRLSRAADGAGAGDGGAAERAPARPARPARVAGGDVRVPAARPHRPGRAARADPRHHHRPASARRWRRCRTCRMTRCCVS